jgi:hypothetical protein
VWQTFIASSGPATEQQICPALQHLLSQHAAPTEQVVAAQPGGALHVPPSQNGLSEAQRLPQLPQLKGSFW